jgi:hypothetical protein
MAAGTSVIGSGAAASAPYGKRRSSKSASGPYNVLFILTGQERYLRPGGSCTPCTEAANAAGR